MKVNRSVLRVGLIGLGRMGRLHARVLRSLEGVALVAAVDPAGDRFNAVDGLPVLQDLDALLRHRIDYAVLACPTSLHEPIGTRLAAKQVPTLIEKPLAATPDAAYRLVEAFRRADIRYAIQK
ncbi:MAG: Gfo/Idh/MocA family protein, partial [Actinomycetes bacterium]